jgi:hypothetical protein
MAGAACKVVINNGVRALIESIERVLIDRDVHQDRIPFTDRMVLIQKLADVDISSLTGDVKLMPTGGVLGILVELEKYGLVTDEVWKVFTKPSVSA